MLLVSTVFSDNCRSKRHSCVTAVGWRRDEIDKGGMHWRDEPACVCVCVSLHRDSQAIRVNRQVGDQVVVCIKLHR